MAQVLYCFIIITVLLMSVQHIYVDTFYLLGYHDKKPDVRRFSRNVLSRLGKMQKSNLIALITPLIALGEAFEKCCHEGHDPSDLVDLITGLDIETPGPNKETYALAKSLIDADDRIESCDALIAAHALLDNDASWLLTTDSTLLTTSAIDEYKAKSGRKITISDRM